MIWPQSNRKKSTRGSTTGSTSRGDLEHQPRRFGAPAEAIWSTSRGDLEHQPRRFGAPAIAISTTRGSTKKSTSRGDLEHQQRRFGAPAEAIWSTSRGDLEHQQLQSAPKRKHQLEHQQHCKIERQKICFLLFELLRIYRKVCVFCNKI